MNLGITRVLLTVSILLTVAACSQNSQKVKLAAGPTATIENGNKEAIAVQTDEPEKPPGSRCPYIKGSSLATDRTSIRSGEAVTLRWKLPREYISSFTIEGLEPGLGPAGSNQLYDPQNPPQFFEGFIPDVRPLKTTRYTLKARGPKGCPDLTLGLTVLVQGRD